MSAADNRKWRVQNGIEGRRALLNGVGVDVDFKRTSHLPDGLRGTIEFRIFKTVSTNKGFDFAGRIINSHHRGLWSGLLLQLDASRRFAKFLNGKLRQVSNLQQLARLFSAGPWEIARGDHCAVSTNLDGGVFIVDRHHQARNVATLFKGTPPVIVLIRFGRAQVVLKNILQSAAPPMTAIIRMQSIAYCQICGSLHGDVQCGVNTQAALMHRFRAIC